MRENAREGTTRYRAPSSVVTPEATVPLESARQRRALRGPKRYAFSVTSSVRDAYADPVQVVKVKGKRRKRHQDTRTYTRNLGGSCAGEYAYGRG